MKGLLLVTLFALAFCFTASAQSYIGIDFGYGMYTLDNNGVNVWKPNHMNATLNIGKSYGLLRTELALMMIMPAETKTTNEGYYKGIYLNEVETTIEYQSFNVLLNLYLDIPVNEKVKIYPMLGIGVSSSKANFKNDFLDASGKSSLAPAFQAGLGACYQLNDSHSIDFTIRYLLSVGAEYEVDDYGGGILGSAVKGRSKDVVPVKATAIKFDLGYKYWF